METVTLMKFKETGKFLGRNFQQVEMDEAVVLSYDGFSVIEDVIDYEVVIVDGYYCETCKTFELETELDKLVYCDDCDELFCSECDDVISGGDDYSSWYTCQICIDDASQEETYNFYRSRPNY